MISKSIFILLCICVIVLSVFVLTLAVMARLLTIRCEKLEMQKEQKKELICSLNNRIDTLVAVNKNLHKRIRELMQEVKERELKNG